MDARKEIASAIRDHLARQRLSRAEFAFRTKLGKSTVDKLLIGLFSDRTLSIVEDHTGLVLRSRLTGTAQPITGELPQPRVPAPEIIDRPSIAVLPFANLGGDPSQDFIADGLTEDIITGLARLRWLFVIARNSTFVYRGRSIDVREVARDLGVRYIIEGSARSAGRRLRLTAQLIEAASGKHIWAERYDRDLADLFAVQDDITARVVAAVEPHLYAEEGTRIATRPPESIDVWGLAVRAMPLINRLERCQNETARNLLAQAIDQEPDYARAHALMAWALWWATLCYWMPDREAGYREAEGYARAALLRDPADPWARMVSGLSLSTARRHEHALLELRLALDLNPSFALGWMALGWSLLRTGYVDEAIEASGKAMRLSPVDSFSGFYSAIHGLALLGARRFTDALPHLRAAVAAFEAYSGHYNTLISCCGHLGLIDEARDFIAIRNRIGPPLTIGALSRNLAGFAHADVFLDGLRKAGVPD